MSEFDKGFKASGFIGISRIGLKKDYLSKQTNF